MQVDQWVTLAGEIGAVLIGAFTLTWKVSQLVQEAKHARDSLTAEVKGLRSEMVAEVRGVRAEVHGLTDWLGKVERAGSDNGVALNDLRVSVARLEGKVDDERLKRDSDRVEDDRRWAGK